MERGMSKFWRAVLLFGQGMEEKEKRAAIAQFIAGLRPFFEPKGFAYAKPYQAFRRKSEDLQWDFALNLFVHADAFTISPLAGVRHDAIERIFHEVSGAPETVQRDSATVLWSWTLNRRPPRRRAFTVDRRSKVPAGVEFTAQFFVKWVEPFFREYGSLAGIDAGLNGGRAILQTRYVTDWFDMLGRALIAARLVGRADYEALKEEYRQVVGQHRSLHPAPVKSFDALAQILDRTPHIPSK